MIHDADSDRVFAVSLKATDDACYVERALARCPEDEVWTTDEVARRMAHDSRVHGTGIFDADLETVTRANFDALLEQETPGHFGVAGAAARGSALVAADQRVVPAGQDLLARGRSSARAGGSTNGR